MSIATVITGGFGNGTFAGSPSLVILDGYSAAPVIFQPNAEAWVLANRPVSWTLPERGTAWTINARSTEWVLIDE